MIPTRLFRLNLKNSYERDHVDKLPGNTELDTFSMSHDFSDESSYDSSFWTRIKTSFPILIPESARYTAEHDVVDDSHIEKGRPTKGVR